MKAVQIKGLAQHLNRVQIIEGLDLEVNTGVFGLLGPNGAGKTTLLRTLATILPPSDGEMRLLGCDPNNNTERRTLRRQIGYLPQTFSYYPDFTVREFIEYMALLREVPSNMIKQRVAYALARVELVERANTPLKTLSGGMLRRAGIAQAIVNQPRLLLLDEPTAGLDPQQRVEFRELLREIGRLGTVIVSTHLVEDVVAACTEVALMKQGRLVFQGTPTDLVAHGQESNVGDTPIERGYSAVLMGVGL